MGFVRHDHDGAPPPWDAAGRERPIFLDEAGRRHRLLRPLGALSALAACGWLLALGLGATGFARLEPLPVAVATRPAALVAPPPTARPARGERFATASVPRARPIADVTRPHAKLDARAPRVAAQVPTVDRS